MSDRALFSCVLIVVLISAGVGAMDGRYDLILGGFQMPGVIDQGNGSWEQTTIEGGQIVDGNVLLQPGGRLIVPYVPPITSPTRVEYVASPTPLILTVREVIAFLPTTDTLRNSYEIVVDGNSATLRSYAVLGFFRGYEETRAFVPSGDTYIVTDTGGTEGFTVVLMSGDGTSVATWDVPFTASGLLSSQVQRAGVIAIDTPVTVERVRVDWEGSAREVDTSIVGLFSLASQMIIAIGGVMIFYVGSGFWMIDLFVNLVIKTCQVVIIAKIVEILWI